MLDQIIKPERKGGLGRSLNILLSQTGSVKTQHHGELRQLPISQLRPGKYQPRKHIPEDTLRELADSIREQGILQPIIVRTTEHDLYEIIAGERRWRAAQIAQLTEVPVLIYVMSDQKALALALIENIQREDLNPIEEAYALYRLIEEFGLTHQQTAEAIGKSRTNVTNTLRLLNLTAHVKQWLTEKKLDMGHARALLILPAEQQQQVAEIVIAKNLSVRETEQLVKTYRQHPKTVKTVSSITPDITQAQTTLSERLGTKVVIHHHTKGKGSLVIYYNSIGELDGIVDRIAS